MTGIPPQQDYSPDNPFAPQKQNYSPENPFAQKQEAPQGFFEHAFELGKGFAKSTFDDATNALIALGDPYNGQARINIATKIAKQQELAAQAAPKFRNDLSNFFDTFSKEQFNKTLEDLNLTITGQESTGQLLAKPFKAVGKAIAPFGKFATYTGLARGIVDDLASPMELMDGVNYAQDNRSLTPEEAADRAKRLLGDATMVLVTHNVAGAVNRGLVGNAITQAAEKGVSTLSAEQLLKVAEGAKVGELGRKVLSSTIGGATGGFAGGLIANTGKSDALESALLQGVMGVPLGFAQEYASNLVKSLRGKVLDTPEQIAEVAKSIFDERQVKLYENDSVEQVMNKLEALKSSDNLSEAAKKLGELKGITEAEFQKELADITPSTTPINEEAAARARVEAARNTPFPGTEQGFNLSTFKQNLYNGFKDFAFATVNGLDSVLPDGWDFDKKLLSYLKLKKIPVTLLDSVREDMLGRIKNDFTESLSPKEQFAMRRLNADLGKASKLASGDYAAQANYTNRKAAEAGMYVDKDVNGTLVLKSRETGEKIMDLRDNKELMDGFVSQNGDVKPLRLGNGLDEAIPNKPPPKNPGPTGGLASPYSPRYGRSEHLIDVLNTTKTGSGFTVAKDVMSSLDNLNKTSFVSRVWDPTQVAYRKVLAKLQPLHEEIQKIANSTKDIKNEDWKKISEYRQQRSVDELTGETSQLEQTQGKWLADNDVDIAKVFAYRRGITNIEKLDLSDVERGARISDLQKNLGMDSKHLEAYTRFQTIISGDNTTSDLGRTIAYANALKSGMSRAEYATKNNMTQRQIKVAESLDKYYDNLAPQLGFNSRQELETILAQGQKYNDYPPSKGEISVGKQRFLDRIKDADESAGLEAHPLAQATRYAAAGIKANDFYPVWKAALQASKEEFRKIDGPKRANARLQVEDYLSGITGNRKQITNGTIEHIAEATNHIRDEAGKNSITTDEVKAGARRWISNYFAISEASAQGFRPSQGLRDFYSSINNYYLRFSADRAARALKLFNSMSKEQIDALEMSGQIGTLKPFEAVLPGDASSSFRGQLARGTEGLLEQSYKYSFQKKAYRNAHAMAYNETYINTMENLAKIADGTLTKEEGYKNMDLHTYDPGIQVQFDKLASSGKDPKAASEFLARLTAAETIFLYGAANQARFMSSIPGALMGQYTTWSTWESRFLTRMMTRGTVRDRLNFARRFAASQTALAAADGLTGLNLSSWFLTPSNVIFRPGPTVQAALNMADATSPNQRTQSQALGQLERQGQLLIPGFQFARGWAQAYDLWNRGFDPASGLARGLGIPIDEQNQNWWDVLLREGEVNIPDPLSDDNESYTIPLPSLGFDKGRQTIPSQILGNEVEKKASNAGRKAVNQQ